ncbi:phosphoglycerate mutase-like protein [Dendrothele bispora CBS 962.96]|uniref:Phosphoglycerate mutase-like protein n=1 Tax=Dendrothele bispora (strain CBS 962.96) TaxID=1314807 RepID=A0A4S8L8A1_DENBC|nr:phosphoglycerate mutase-like protein [Dendrothele bispora CBS 962.96]
MPPRSYQAVSGFFVQDEATDPSTVGPLPPRFGLIDDSPERWKLLETKIRQMNDVEPGVSYKVIIFGRHGQGWHNVGESKYGTEAWDEYWSKLDGDGEITWGPDAELTPLGEDQARSVTSAWKSELPFDIPVPKRNARFCSPMTRAFSTYSLTFAFENEGLKLQGDQKPVILENCREEYGEHTCDKRRTKTYIRERFPDFSIRGGISADTGVFTEFSEEDELWLADQREADNHVATRAKTVLDRIFDSHELKSEYFISVTAHGGIINGFLRSMDRPSYSLPTGGVLPVVVKCIIS